MDFEQIKKLELELNDPSVRKRKDRLEQLLADDFEEVGKSGTRFSKTDIIAALLSENALHYVVEDLRFTPLSDDAVLVKYKTILNNQAALRSSIWIKKGDHWQLIYHQGTELMN